MCAMQGSSGQDEQLPPEFAEATPRTQDQAIKWAVLVSTGIYIVWALYATMQDETVRLHYLNQLVKLLHKTTRALGNLAITVEKAYYDYADTLHS